MNDLGLRPFAPGPRPPGDGFARAIRGARRRRLRTIGTGVLCSAAAFMTAVLGVVPRVGAGVDGLQPASPPRLPTTAARPHDLRATPQATPTPYGTRAPGPATVARSWPVTPPAGGAPGATTSVGSPAARPAVPAMGLVTPSAEPAPNDPAMREPIDLTYEDQSVTAPCDGSTWCVTADVTGAAGDAARTLRVHVCRATSDTSGVLTFQYDEEADFRVAYGGTVVWQWSFGQDDVGDPHTVAVDRWQCAVWSTPWHRVDQDGNALGTGQYQAGALVRRSGSMPAWLNAPFDVT